VSGWSLTLSTGIQLSNSSRIAVNSTGVTGFYPSISGLGGAHGRIIQVIATLYGVSHARPADLDVLLVGPDGVGVLLMSDAVGSNALTDATLTFDDSAARALPEQQAATTGLYRPANYGSGVDPFVSPAPSGPYGASLSAFAGRDPNADWKLYVIDDTNDIGGEIARGWSVSIILDPTAPTTSAQLTPTANAGGWTNADTTVILTVTDTGGAGVQKITYSAFGAVSFASTTILATTVPISITVEGVTTLNYFATDRAGNVEATPSLVVRLDKTLPSATAPRARLLAGRQLSTSTMPVTLQWSGADGLSGLSRFQLQESVGGGAFAGVPVSPAKATTSTRQLTPGTTDRKRVRSADQANNISAFATGASFTPTAIQENAASLVYGGRWTSQALNAAFGGTLRFANTAGATATVTFTGRSIAWVSLTAANRGQAQVRIDGGAPVTVDLYTPTTRGRWTVFAANGLAAGTHSMVITVLGTKNAASGGTRVDIDALLFLP